MSMLISVSLFLIRDFILKIKYNLQLKGCDKLDNLGDKIKQIRVSRKLTQQDIAQSLGVARNTVSQWENNERNISAEQLIRYAQLVKVPLDFFNNKTADETFFYLMQNLSAFFHSENISSSDKDAAYQDIMRLYLKSKELNKLSENIKVKEETQDKISRKKHDY